MQQRGTKLQCSQESVAVNHPVPSRRHRQIVCAAGGLDSNETAVHNLVVWFPARNRGRCISPWLPLLSVYVIEFCCAADKLFEAYLRDDGNFLRPRLLTNVEILNYAETPHRPVVQKMRVSGTVSVSVAFICVDSPGVHALPIRLAQVYSTGLEHACKRSIRSRH